MKNYLVFLFVLMMAISCGETDDELINITDSKGNVIAPPPGGGGTGGGGGTPVGGGGTPIGGGGGTPVGGGGGGGGIAGCPLANCTTVTTVSGCMSRNSLTTLEILNHGTDINWTVLEGDFITISKFENTITLFGGDDFNGGIVVGTGPSVSFTFDISVCPPTPPCRPSNTVVVLEEYLDGTESGQNVVHLKLSSNWPAGTTYAWQTVREDGTVKNYSASTQKIRRVSASRENPITRVIVTAKYGTCERGIITDFSPAVPQEGSSGGPTSVSGLKFIEKFILSGK